MDIVQIVTQLVAQYPLPSAAAAIVIVLMLSQIAASSDRIGD